MNQHELTVLAIGEALKAARELVRKLEFAHSETSARQYTRARTRISDAVTSASYLDQHYLPNCGRALDGSK